MFWFWMTMRRVILFCRSKTRENYDAQIYFGLILIFCKYLHYFVPGYYGHSCHLYVKCACYLDKIWYFYVKIRKLRHFKVYNLCFTSRYQAPMAERYHIISYHIISYHIISYHIISYHIKLYSNIIHQNKSIKE